MGVADLHRGKFVIIAGNGIQMFFNAIITPVSGQITDVFRAQLTKLKNYVKISEITGNLHMVIKKKELYCSLWASCDKLRGGMDASQYKMFAFIDLFAGCGGITQYLPQRSGGLAG